jgi:hypothetical protein
MLPTGETTSPSSKFPDQTASTLTSPGPQAFPRNRIVVISSLRCGVQKRQNHRKVSHSTLSSSPGESPMQRSLEGLRAAASSIADWNRRFARPASNLQLLYETWLSNPICAASQPIRAKRNRAEKLLCRHRAPTPGGSTLTSSRNKPNGLLSHRPFLHYIISATAGEREQNPSAFCGCGL